MNFINSETFVWGYIFIVGPLLLCFTAYLHLATRPKRRR